MGLRYASSCPLCVADISDRYLIPFARKDPNWLGSELESDFGLLDQGFYIDQMQRI
jgi:hypothetical protein